MTDHKGREILKFVPLLIVLIFCAVWFRSFLWTNLIEPATLVLWAIWRAISSVNQLVYWQLIIWAAIFFLVRFLPTKVEKGTAYQERNNGLTLKGLLYWQLLLHDSREDAQKQEQLRHDLEQLLIQGLSVRERTDPAVIRDQLQKHEIKMPVAVYQYLFSNHSGARSRLNHFRRVFFSRLSPIFPTLVTPDQKTLRTVLNWMEQTLEVPVEHAKQN